MAIASDGEHRFRFSLTHRYKQFLQKRPLLSDQKSRSLNMKMKALANDLKDRDHRHWNNLFDFNSYSLRFKHPNDDRQTPIAGSFTQYQSKTILFGLTYDSPKISSLIFFVQPLIKFKL